MIFPKSASFGGILLLATLISCDLQEKSMETMPAEIPPACVKYVTSTKEHHQSEEAKSVQPTSSEKLKEVMPTEESKTTELNSSTAATLPSAPMSTEPASTSGECHSCHHQKQHKAKCQTCQCICTMTVTTATVKAEGAQPETKALASKTDEVQPEKAASSEVKEVKKEPQPTPTFEDDCPEDIFVPDLEVKIPEQRKEEKREETKTVEQKQEVATTSEMQATPAPEEANSSKKGWTSVYTSEWTSYYLVTDGQTSWASTSFAGCHEKKESTTVSESSMATGWTSVFTSEWTSYYLVEDGQTSWAATSFKGCHAKKMSSTMTENSMATGKESKKHGEKKKGKRHGSHEEKSDHEGHGKQHKHHHGIEHRGGDAFTVYITKYYLVENGHTSWATTSFASAQTTAEPVSLAPQTTETISGAGGYSKVYTLVWTEYYGVKDGATVVEGSSFEGAEAKTMTTSTIEPLTSGNSTETASPTPEHTETPTPENTETLTPTPAETTPEETPTPTDAVSTTTSETTTKTEESTAISSTETKTTSTSTSTSVSVSTETSTKANNPNLPPQ